MKRRDFLKVTALGAPLRGLLPAPAHVHLSGQSTGLRPLPNRANNTLATLKFKNSGIVRREMRFEYLEQPVAYAEDVEHWNIQAKAKYLYQIEGSRKTDPPTGMRSAVPLGGLGSGTVELRADGSFRDWNIFNNSPAGGPKIQIDDAFFGLWTRQKGRDPKSWALRTHPPLDLPPIAQIEYSGAFPVSRLRFADPGLPTAVDLYGYSEFHPSDPKASATPAAIFTFNLHNPSLETIEVAAVFILRNYTKGRAKVSNQLTFLREGAEPTSGSVVIKLAGKASEITSATGSDLASLWTQFSSAGHLRNALTQEEVPEYGGLAARTRLGPGESRALSFVLAWHLPFRPFKSEVPGNYYTNLYQDASEVAERALGRLESTWEAIRGWQSTVFDNSLPEWLQDALINSLGTMYKTGMWLRDGRWRQWESFSCAGLDPLHIDTYRILPSAFFFPSLQKQLLSANAHFQRADGFLYEQMTTGCFTAESELDQPGGREMGDGATDFILQAWLIYSWTGDKEYLGSIWTNVKKAADWQINRSQKYGLPQRLTNTYDWWEFEKKDLVSYNAFLHLAAMLASEKLAGVQGEAELAERCRKAFEAGQQSLYQHFWTGDYFRSWWLAQKPSPDALHADTLYGQLWAFILDLGLTADAKRLAAHLYSESNVNSSPFGLKVMRREDPEHPEAENTIPAGEGSQLAERDNIIWQAGSLDWCSLNLYLNTSAGQSLEEAEKIIRNWRDRLRDQWNYTDTGAGWDGYPWCNSHYTRQLIFWAIPLALSGQHYFAPEGRLSFDPKIAAPTKLPFFTPPASGVLQLLGDGRYQLTVISGELELRLLRVGNAELRKPVSLRAGQSVSLASE